MILKIPQEIWQQMIYYTEASAPNEVTGIGLLEVVDTEAVRVKEIFLPEQQANGHECQFAEGALNEVLLDVIERGEQPELLCFRWHSHVNGQVFWSAKDQADIEAWEGDWLVSLVMNVYRECLARFDLFRPFRLRNVSIVAEVEYPENAELRQRCVEEVRQRVTELPLPVSSRWARSIDEIRKDTKGGETSGLF